MARVHATCIQGACLSSSGYLSPIVGTLIAISSSPGISMRHGKSLDCSRPESGVCVEKSRRIAGCSRTNHHLELLYMASLCVVVSLIGQSTRLASQYDQYYWLRSMLKLVTVFTYISV